MFKYPSKNGTEKTRSAKTLQNQVTKTRRKMVRSISKKIALNF